MSFNEESIEAFVSGKLNATDKMAMEEGMLNDPNLKSEVDLQRDIIESLKNTRKLQLKNRLNNIDVASGVGSGVSNTVKVAASVITVGIIGAGIYYYSLFSSDKTTAENNKSSELVEVESLSLNTKSDEVALNSSNRVVESTVTASTKASETSANTRNSKKRNQDGAVNDLNVSAIVPNGEFESNEGLLKSKSVELPDGGIVETVDRKTMNLDVQIEDGNKKDLNYKYFSNKLFLYGDFKDQPYDLVEINSASTKQLYLGYNGKFYELKSNQTTVARLKEVKDVSLLEQLSNKNK